MYDDIRDPSKDIAFRKNEEKHNRINGSTLGTIPYLVCGAVGGSESSCDKALVLGALVGDVLGARADAKSNRITSPAQLNPAMRVQFGLGRTQNAQKGNNGNAVTSDMSSTKTNSFGLTKAADTISNLLSPSRRADKANAEKRAQQIIENNFYAEQSGYGWDINKLRTFQDGGVYRAENINASMLSDRDALTRVDAAKKQSDIDIQKLLGKEPQRYSTGYPAWKEGTASILW